MESHPEPGTIDVLVADAVASGHQVTPRLVTDWVSWGLLDRPTRQPRGRGKGSSKAQYTGSQRELFQTLLAKRGEGVTHVRSLARVPIFVWVYWGEEYVPVRQAMRALTTWLGDSRASLAQARQAAETMLAMLDHPRATPAARRELKDAVTDTAYTGRLDPDRLEQAVREVFEPTATFGRLSRAIGHPGAQLTAESVVHLIKARHAAASAVQAGRLTEAELTACRQQLLMTRSEYMAMGPAIASTQDEEMMGTLYADLTQDSPQRRFDSCAVDLLTVIGLDIRARGRPLTFGRLT